MEGLAKNVIYSAVRKSEVPAKNPLSLIKRIILIMSVPRLLYFVLHDESGQTVLAALYKKTQKILATAKEFSVLYILFWKLYISNEESKNHRFAFYSFRVLYLSNLTWGFFWIFVLYSTWLHLPPPQIPLCRGMLGSNLGLLRFWHWASDAIAI
jgi:hypothetical protein